MRAGSDSPAPSQRLFAYTGGLLGLGQTPARLRRILALCGYRLAFGRPSQNDAVAVWGHSRHAWRGERMAARGGAELIRLEDPFIRSIRPGRAGGPPIGLLVDRQGSHFNPAWPSHLETLLARHPLDDAPLLARARAGMARMRHLDLSKYNIHVPGLLPPPPGYVLVIDQTRGDASLTHGGPEGPLRETLFREMLVFAQTENPGARILIKAHPETMAGHRPGHYTQSDTSDKVTLFTDPVSPHALLEGATAVYTVSSLLGFEAILAGHRPRVFGYPFYAGWGLTDDENSLSRRTRRLSRAQLFAAAMLLYPKWYDPCRDRLCSFEHMLDQMEAELRAFRDDRKGHVALGMRLWKRNGLQKFFGHERRLKFTRSEASAMTLAQQQNRDLMVWARHETGRLADAAMSAGLTLRRVEDGFLRSRGLGATLTPALSLVCDDLGIYYDPSRPSRLERLIAGALPPGGRERAESLVAQINSAGLSKYNIGGDIAELETLPAGRRILVPGQVEDDASIHLGAGEIRTNLELLEKVRAENPDAVILYKPHPDVEAGLRLGRVPDAATEVLADRVLRRCDPVGLIHAVDEVWTITSLLGFEALLRGKPVTCLGIPFYAGWGLTRDIGPVPDRRQAQPDIATLAHAALISYPRYLDPVSGLPCPPEVVAERLADGFAAPSGPVIRLLSKLQGVFASQAQWWR